MIDLDATFGAYVECALWSSLDDDGNALDNVFEPSDLTDEARNEMRAELCDFLALCKRDRIDLSEIDDEMIGHDFWLTRNGHGAGFWDRGLGELGERLTTLAHSYGESYVYVGDDGRIYVA